MNNLFLFVLLAITFAFGLVVGDAWSPLSGTHTLTRRTTELEERVAELEARCAKLEATKERLAEWFGDVRVTAVDAGK